MTNVGVRTNRQVVLDRRPVGALDEADFRMVEGPIPAPGAGQLLVRTLWLSLDPYMRLRAAGHDRYYPAVPLGEPMMGGAVSRVVESCHPGFAPGDIIEDYTGWQDYAVAEGASARRVDPSLGKLSSALHVLGMPGLTGYLALVDVGRPEPGDTLVVAAAAGAVGSVVGQVGKIAGCQVIGIVGGAEKAAYITQELGFRPSNRPTQFRRCPRTRPSLPERHQRLLRERRWIDQRGRVCTAGAARSCRSMWGHRRIYRLDAADAQQPAGHPVHRGACRRF